MNRHPPISKPTYPLFPYTTLFHSEPTRAPDRPPYARTTPCAVSSPSDDRGCDRRRPRAHRYRATPTCSRSGADRRLRSEEHTSELQSLMSTSYAVFCLKKKNHIN